MLNDMKEKMKEQQDQIAALQNNQPSMQSESKPKVSGSPDLQALDELIQKQIADVKLQSLSNAFN